MAKNNRFEVIHSEGNGIIGARTVLVDQETGVNYLYFQSGNSGGLTVLLDAQGKPIVTAIPQKQGK